MPLFYILATILQLYITILPLVSPMYGLGLIATLLVAWQLFEDDLDELRRQLADGEPFAVSLSSW